MSLTKSRFAPSPTGLMHIGNARTALFSALLGDLFLLRIEDTDGERSRREFVDELLHDLKWLGIEWQEGPKSGEPNAQWFQSERTEIYQTYYQALEDNNQAYPCFCSSAELEIARKVQLSSGKPPKYSGKCSRLSPDEVQKKIDQGLLPTLRFRVPHDTTIEFVDGVRGNQRFQTQDIGDFIIRRADGTSAFFFCNAIDDALMGVTHVLRGEDHLANTPRQMMILGSLELPIPHYSHGSLILGEDGAPLSKRNGSRSIGELRDQGYFPLALINMMARLGHHYESDELMSFELLKANFHLTHLGKSPARFDFAHLDHWQTLAIRHASNETIATWLMKETMALIPIDQHTDFIDIVRSNCLFPHQAHVWAEILFTDTMTIEESSKEAAQSAGEAFYLSALDAANEAGNDFSCFMDSLKARTGAKGRALFMPLRAAFTGRHDGPDLATLYRVIDSGRLHRRLAQHSYAQE